MNKRQYEKAFDKFKLLEQGLNLRNSYGKNGLTKTLANEANDSTLPMSWEQTYPTTARNHYEGSGTGEITLSMVSSNEQIKRYNKLRNSTDNKVQTISHFRLPASENRKYIYHLLIMFSKFEVNCF